MLKKIKDLSYEEYETICENIQEKYGNEEIEVDWCNICPLGENVKKCIGYYFIKKIKDRSELSEEYLNKKVEVDEIW